MSIWRWADWISHVPSAARITLGEGNTPLLRSRGIGLHDGLPKLYFKVEGGNPSGSYKDRFAVMAVSRMVADGRRVCLATSSGNAGAALAAYCAAAGLACRIVLVESAPEGKLKQMLSCGADLCRVAGFGTDPDITRETFDHLQRLGEQPGCAFHISAYRYSPEAMTGCETIALEIAERAADDVDHVFCPSGGGGLCLAVARGFRSIDEAGHPARCPAVHCVQPAGNNTIAGPLQAGHAARDVRCTTLISGLQVASVIDGDSVIAACRASGGTGHVVSDDEVWTAQRRLAREEGLFTEPAGAVALAGALSAVRDGRINRDATIVCLVTGSGFKDEAAVDRMIADAACPLIESTDLDDFVRGR